MAYLYFSLQNVLEHFQLHFLDIEEIGVPHFLDIPVLERDLEIVDIKSKSVTVRWQGLNPDQVNANPHFLYQRLVSNKNV